MNRPEGTNTHRVLAVIQGAAFGGAHNQVIRLHKRLEDKGFPTTVVMTDEPGSAAERLRLEGIPLRLERLARVRATKPIATLKYILGFGPQVHRLRRHIRVTNASIVQVHGITNIDVAIAGYLEHVAVVWQIIDTRAPGFLRKLLSPLVVTFADAVLVTGTTILGFYPSLYRAQDRVVSFFPPVGDREDEEIAQARARGRSALKLSEHELAVGCLANLNPQKGHSDLLNSFLNTKAHQEQANVRLLIRGANSPGHDRYRTHLDAIVKASKLPANTVSALPESMDTFDFVAALDLFCMSAVGRSEGTPTVVIEAMQAGVPVITTRAGGVIDLVRDGHDGVLVPLSDETAMTNAIDELVNDDEARRRMGLSARTRAQTILSIDKCEQAYLSAYASALRRASARFGSTR